MNEKRLKLKACINKIECGLRKNDDDNLSVIMFTMFNSSEENTRCINK